MTEKIINSKDNEKIKLLRKLQQKKYRRQYGLFLVENLKTIMDALAGKYAFEMLYVTQEFINAHEKEFSAVIEKQKASEYFVLPANLFNELSELDTPAGICAVYKIPKQQLDFTENIIYLNAVADPGNLGAILRSAVAFDFKNIIVDEKCVDIYNAKTIQAAKNSIFELNIVEDSGRKLLAEAKSKGLKIIATSMTSRAKELFGWRAKGKLCLVFGSEARGIDSELIQISDKIIKIKISRKIESLGVSSAVAIVLYHIYQQA